MMICVRLLSELMILLSFHHVTNHLAYELYTKLYIDIWEVILYLQAKPYRLKTKILIASFLLAPLLNN